MKKEKKKNGIWCFVVLAALLAGVLAAAGRLYADRVRENERLAEELRQKNMEISIRTMVEEQRRLRKEEAEREQREREEHRLQLKNDFLVRDRNQLLALVNPWNPISPETQPCVTEIGDKMQIDERCAGALKQMLYDCRQAGGFPVPISAYRTQEYQQELFDNKVERVIASGTDPELAVSKAAQSVAFPGTSEHQLGLAVDIVDEIYPELDYQQQWTGTQQWLMEHCTEYGFILRYPVDAGEITGIIFEPWHYRYVGRSAAAEMKELGITLEEYTEMKKG